MNEMEHAWGIGWVWIIVLIVLVVVIWMIIKSMNQKKPIEHHEKSAQDILNERYAKGEISKQEYDVKKKAIS
jgi:putative membrane protein